MPRASLSDDPLLISRSGSAAADEDENVVTSATAVPELLSIESVEEDVVMKKVVLSLKGGMSIRTTTSFELMNPQRFPYTEAMLKLMPESVAEEQAAGEIQISLKSAERKSAAPAANPLPNLTNLMTA